MSVIISLKNRRSVGRRSTPTPTIFCVISLIIAIGNFSGCALWGHERLVYDREGIRIALVADPTVRESDSRSLNNHPIDLTAKNLEAILQPIQVSGYSGTLVGLMTKPQPVPLFTPKELSAISEHLATAFQEAKPMERVFFSLPKPDVTYSEARTVGYLFFRDPYLHMVLTDHSSIIPTDTGGGDYRDFRDTKGMKLWVTGPARAATVPDPEEPRWAYSEKVHISLVVKEVLALKERVPAAGMNQGAIGSAVSSPAAAPPENARGRVSSEDLQLQIRELSGANQELRDRLDEQSKRMQELQDQLERLRRDLPHSAPQSKPPKAAPAQ